MQKHNNVWTQKSGCTSCVKNDSLIKKYEQLINLYKKKQCKFNEGKFSKRSSRPTTSHTLYYLYSESSCLRFGEILTNIIKNRCSPFFRRDFNKNKSKVVLFNIFKKIEKFTKIKSLEKIKKFNEHNVGIPKLLEQKLNNVKEDTFRTIRKFTRNSGTSQQILNTQKHQYIKYQLTEIQNYCCSISKNRKGLKWLNRRNIELQIINKKLIRQNQILKQCLEQCTIREIKENKQNKQHLDVLEEEICSKNQQIKQRIVKEFQGQFKLSGNELDFDAEKLKKDMNNLETQKQKLSNELNKIKLSLEETQQKLKVMTQKNEQLTQENIKMKKKDYWLQHQTKKAENKIIQYSKVLEIFNKKMKRLTAFQKELVKGYSNNGPHQKYERIKIQEEVKLEIVFMFLANISNVDYQLHAEHLFEEGQKILLKQHKQNWLNYLGKTQKNVQNTLSIIGNVPMFDINTKEENSIKSVLTALHPSLKNIKNKTSTMTQLEHQKNQYIGKISQLQQKLLHIRVIILKLLKSLSIEKGSKPEAENILRILFGLFEYSEAERQCIYVKKNKLLWFI